MNGKFICNRKVCNKYGNCKIRKSIGLACVLSGLGIEMKKCHKYRNDRKVMEIKSYTTGCDVKECRKKELIYKLINKHNKFMRLRITHCGDYIKCCNEHMDSIVEKIKLANANIIDDFEQRE